MKQFSIAVYFFAVLAFSSVALAAASTQGVTGVIDIPTADILPQGRFNAAAYRLHDEDTYSLSMGIGQKLEAAVMRRLPDEDGDFTALHLKYALRRESILTPGMAIGIDDALAERERSVYAVWSKGLPFGIRAHLGIGDGRFDGVFGSLEKQIVKGRLGRFPTTALLVENDGRDMNYGLRVSLSQQVKLQLGYRDSDVYVGLSGSF